MNRSLSFSRPGADVISDSQRSDYSQTNTVLAVLRRRLESNRDGQVIITSRGSERGLGKTTLAIRMARALEGPEWPHEERAFVNVDDYLTAYMNAPEGAVLILDEGEHGADSRRAMSKENVDLSQAWATMRYRNVITLVTLPSVSMLDNRLKELADFRINVLKRGTALPMNIQVNDFTGKVSERPIKQGSEYELIHFSDLDDDPAFDHLTAIKDTEVTGGVSRFTEEEVEAKVNQTEREARKSTRDTLLAQVYLNTDLSQKAVAEAIEEPPGVGVSQPTVARAVEAFEEEEDGGD